MRPVALPFDVRKRRPRWRRWLLWLGGSLLVSVAALACLEAYEHHRAVRRLEEALAQLDQDDPGWRLEDLEAARAEVPGAENSARRVVAAARLLPKDWPAPEFAAELDDLDPPELLDADRADRLAKELDGLGPALGEARALADLPRGRHAVVYAPNVMETLLGDQQRARDITHLLRYDALRRAQAGDMKGALRSCRAALNAARSIGDEPFAISQLQRMACSQLAGQTVEYVLAQGEPHPEELAALQRLFEDESRHPATRILLRGERAVAHHLMEAIEGGRVTMSQWVEGWSSPPTWDDRLWGWRFRRKVREEHPFLLAAMTRRAEAADRPLHEQIEADTGFVQEVHSRSAHAPLSRLLIPMVEKTTAAVRRAQAYVRSAVALLAAERYRLTHGSWPDTLDRLVPEFLPEVPLDPYDGEPLRYRRWAQGVVAYSVGEDRRDDRGTIDHKNTLDYKNPLRPGIDLGYRLWDPAHRRRPPRPPEVGPP